LAVGSVFRVLDFGGNVTAETETKGFVIRQSRGLAINAATLRWAVASYRRFSLNYEIRVPVPTHRDA
jgi:hypothetical protein